MSKKTLEKLINTYKNVQDEQLKRLSKISAEIEKLIPNIHNDYPDLSYHITDITAMTEPSGWAEHLLEELEVIWGEKLLKELEAIINENS